MTTATELESPRALVRRLVHDMLPKHGDYTTSQVAQKILKKMQTQHSGALAELQEEITYAWFREFVQDYITNQRSVFRRATQGQTTKDVLERIEAGDSEAIDVFQISYVVDAENTRRSVADMTGEDHRFVASNYEADASGKLMLAAFHRAVAKKVGSRRTSEVLTPERYLSLLESITKKGSN